MSGSRWIEFGLHAALHLDQQTQRGDAPTEEYKNPPGNVCMMSMKQPQTERCEVLNELSGVSNEGGYGA